MRNVIQWHKIAIFKKLQKLAQQPGFCPQTLIASDGWELRPQTPVGDPLELHYFTQCRPFRFLSFGSSPLPLAKSWFRAKPGPGF